MTEATRQKRYAYTREWRKRNPEWIRQYSKEYAKAHPEKAKSQEKREYGRLYRINNSERLKAFLRNRYASNKAEHLSRCRAYYAKNKEKISEKGKAYRAKNKEALAKRSAEYRKKHSAKFVEKAREYAKKYPERVRVYKKKWADAHKYENCLKAKIRRAKISGVLVDEEKKQRVYQFYKWLKNQDYISCTYCGVFVSGKSVHVDHIVPLSRGGDHDVDNFAVSCDKCNRSKADFLLSEWPQCPEKFKHN